MYKSVSHPYTYAVYHSINMFLSATLMRANKVKYLHHMLCSKICSREQNIQKALGKEARKQASSVYIYV